jgi:hypothetical protein
LFEDSILTNTDPIKIHCAEERSFEKKREADAKINRWRERERE